MVSSNRPPNQSILPLTYVGTYQVELTCTYPPNVGSKCPKVLKNLKETWRRKAIELGDSDAMYLVGVHRLGEKDFKSNRIGISLIEQAAERGHDGALYYLALLVSTFMGEECYDM